MNGLQSSGAESFSQSRDPDMTEESSYANPTGWGDNKSDRCTTLPSAHFTKKDWPTRTKLAGISFSPETGVSQLHQPCLDCESNWAPFWEASGSECTGQFPVCEAEERSYQSSISPHVTATLLWGVRDGSTGKCCPLALCGECWQPPPRARGHGKRNGALWSFSGMGSWRLLGGSEHSAPTALLVTHHRNAQLQPASAPQHSTVKGEGSAEFTRADWQRL